MLDISAMENFLDDGTNGSDEPSPPQEISLENWDGNSDDEISCEDCPFQKDTFFARRWFTQVLMPWTESQVTDEMREQYGDAVVGAYKGKALVPGAAGPGQGDYDLMVDKLKLCQGFDNDAAERIAASVKNKLYGV